LSNLIITVKILAATVFLGGALLAPAQTTFTDDFSKPHDYVTEGVRGTIWDGVYLGAGEIADPMGLGMAAGETSVAAAGNGVLTVTSLQTDWESAADDGFFLFKMITGDFDMSVQIAGPIDTHAHNFPGLMVRNFGPGGAPAPNKKENYFIWGRFDEYNIANMLKNETDGVKRDRGLGVFPNTNYWLRVQRIGDVFNFFEKGSATDDWNRVGSITRTNFSGALQAGIEHADYDGGRVLSARYQNFSLTASNMGPFVAEPSPATDLKVVAVKGANGPGARDLSISWTAGPGSVGSLVVVWTGNPALKEAPANGVSYHVDGAPLPGQLPGQSCFVAYAGSGTTATFGAIPPGPAHIAVFSYAGSGNSITYSRVPARNDP
jgi:hypothetical protein